MSNGIPTIQATAATIYKWIDSCDNEDQLNLCRHAVQYFIADRYKHYLGDAEIHEALSKLTIQIINKSNFLILKRNNHE